MDFKMIWYPQLTGLGALEPLDSYLDTWEGASDIKDGVWNIVKQDGDDSIRGIPYEFVVQVLYYRTDLFEEAGVEPPATMEDFFALAPKLTKEGQYGYGLRGSRYGHEAWASIVLAAMADP
jgi:multiple sugar transport system substrate-binding protein